MLAAEGEVQREADGARKVRDSAVMEGGWECGTVIQQTTFGTFGSRAIEKNTTLGNYYLFLQQKEIRNKSIQSHQTAKVFLIATNVLFAIQAFLVKSQCVTRK